MKRIKFRQGQGCYCNPYQPCKVSKTIKIEGGSSYQKKRWTHEKGWMCQGVFMLKTEVEPKAGKNTMKVSGLIDELISGPMFKNIDRIPSAAPLMEVQGLSMDRPMVYLENIEGARAIVDAGYFDLIMSHYPKASHGFRVPKEPIYFFHAGEVVAVIMPIKWDNLIQADYENLILPRMIETGLKPAAMKAA